MIAFSTKVWLKNSATLIKRRERRKRKTRLSYSSKTVKEAVEKVTELERQESIQTKTGKTKILNRLLISRPPRASVTGAAHKETIPTLKSIKGVA